MIHISINNVKALQTTSDEYHNMYSTAKKENWKSTHNVLFYTIIYHHAAMHDTEENPKYTHAYNNLVFAVVYEKTDAITHCIIPAIPILIILSTSLSCTPIRMSNERHAYHIKRYIGLSVGRSVAHLW